MADLSKPMLVKARALLEERSRQVRLAVAEDDEMTFVLLGRDAAAPVAIRAWVKERIRLGKNTQDDAQILEALACAANMEYDRGSR